MGVPLSVATQQVEMVVELLHAYGIPTVYDRFRTTNSPTSLATRDTSHCNLTHLKN